jgi:membrane protease YdiL (CAAX protease family)
LASHADKPFFKRLAIYMFLCVMGLWFASALFWITGSLFFAGAFGNLIAGLAANGLSVRIHERMRLTDVGLGWNTASRWNLLLGIAGGASMAALVLIPPLVAGAATMQRAGDSLSASGILFVGVLLLAGSAGEELMFRGYGLQLLIQRIGAYTAILPISMIFALMHGGNPHATYLAIVNTAGFGALFGYALIRSGDLWLPIGLHFGWNVALPVFGVNVSGFTMKMTPYTMTWNTGAVWSGGDYGPEGGILTSVGLVALGIFLWKAPIRKQRAPLLEPEHE